MADTPSTPKASSPTVSSPTEAPLLRPAAYWPWRLAAASYLCLVLALVLSEVAHRTHYGSATMLWQGMVNVTFSATVLLGLTLLVTACTSACLSCVRRLNIIDVAVILVTLPPIAFHARFVLW